MHCKAVRLLFNDLLDNTLHAGEQHQVSEHLKTCDSCRNEFLRMERADNILRGVVRDMVSSIDVPGTLGLRIEKRLFGEQRRKRTLAESLGLIIRKPAIAAAIIFIVTTAGILSFYNHFSLTGRQSDMVMQSPSPNSNMDFENSAVSEAGREAQTAAVPLTGAAADDSSEKQAELNNERASDTQKSIVKKPAIEEAPLTIAQVPRDLENTQDSNGKQAVTGVIPLGTGAAGPAMQRGTLEEAAAEVGFNPAIPSYLPGDVELVEVSWLSGTVHQHYRVDQLSFTVSQSLAGATEINLQEEDPEAKLVWINGENGTLRETSFVTDGDIVGGSSTLRWQQGEYFYTITGELPEEEIMKIAASLK